MKRRLLAFLLLITFITTVNTGCAAALVAGGLVGGYALAKDMEDGKLIDTPDKKDSEEKKKKYFWEK